MSELRSIFLGLGHGLKDSLFGMTALLRISSILGENLTENQLKADNQSSFRRTRHRGRTSLNAPEKKADRCTAAVMFNLWYNCGFTLCLGNFNLFSSVSMKEIYSKMLQCCLLNGGIFWMSIFLFESYIIPGLQNLTHFIFNMLSRGNPQQSLWLWRWMGPFLSYLFSAFWVLPLYWLSKPLNSLWYQEIADSAYRTTRGRPLGFLATFGRESLSSHVSKTVADFFFSLLLQMFFLVQAMVVSFLPILGPLISLGHMCLLYSLYTFEYKWVNMGWTAPKRLMYVESNWPYFVGFGLPLAIFTSLAPSFVISGCVFAILFPLFIISGNQAKVVETNQVPVKLFSIVIWLTNKVFTRRPVTSKTQASGPDSTEGT